MKVVFVDLQMATLSKCYPFVNQQTLSSLFSSIDLGNIDGNFEYVESWQCLPTLSHFYIKIFNQNLSPLSKEERSRMLCFGVLLCAWTNVIWRLMEQTTTQSFLKRIHFFSTNMTHFYFFLRHFFSFWTHFSLFLKYFPFSYRTHFSFHKIMDTLLFSFHILTICIV